MVEVDITYDIEQIDNFFDEEKIKEFVSYILKDEYKEEFDKNEYYLSLLITTNDEIQKIAQEVSPILTEFSSKISPKYRSLCCVWLEFLRHLL